MKHWNKAPAAMLRELEYDPATGLFRWSHPHHRQPSGWFEGNKGVRQYRRLWWKDRHYLAHRVAWRLMTGRWPRNEIDHIDHDQSNNRWSNLRAATHKQNGKNTRLRTYNKTGVRNVSLFGDRYRVVVMQTHIGLYDTIEAAAKAARIARRKYYGRFA